MTGLTSAGWLAISVLGPIAVAAIVFIIYLNSKRGKQWLGEIEYDDEDE
ncbi:MAG: hypothetical protein LBT73_01370 [Tannerellaceae bacterium]|jgi:hypothetical protein|nr:hypothetical protein [Tannerellaceae bacterium]